MFYCIHCFHCAVWRFCCLGWPQRKVSMARPCVRYSPPRNRLVRASWPAVLASCMTSTTTSLRAQLLAWDRISPSRITTSRTVVCSCHRLISTDWPTKYWVFLKILTNFTFPFFFAALSFLQMEIRGVFVDFSKYNKKYSEFGFVV